MNEGEKNMKQKNKFGTCAAALIGLLRERSIQAHAADLALPKLDDPQTILDGAGHYAAMCTGCHLAPGMADSEIRPGLYPRPPNLSKVRPPRMTMVQASRSSPGS